MATSVAPQVEELVRMLREGASADRHRAAIELGRFGIRTRGSSPPRGRLGQSQKSQFPGDYHSYLEAARAAFQDADPDVRREVAFALGEWGDATAVEILRWIVLPDEGGTDPDPRVRAAAVRALGRIGGPKAVQALEKLAVDDPSHDVRSNAITALGELARSEYKYRAARRSGRGKAPPPRSGAVRTRGSAVRTRGASPVRAMSKEARQVLDLLAGVRSNDPSSRVRDLADEVLRDLGD